MAVNLLIEKVVNEIKYKLYNRNSYFQKVHKRIIKKKETKYFNCSSIMLSKDNSLRLLIGTI